MISSLLVCRLPTATEWNAEMKSWGSNNADGALNPSLKLPIAGYRATTVALYDLQAFDFG